VRLPQRTEVIFAKRVPIGELLRGGYFVYVPRESDIVELRCVDCGYRTNLVEAMLLHQERQARAHSYRQRLRRWWETRSERTRRAVVLGYGGLLFVLALANLILLNDRIAAVCGLTLIALEGEYLLHLYRRSRQRR